MRCALLSLVSLLLLPLCLRAAEPAWLEHPDWRSEFSERGVVGTALVFDESSNRYEVLDRARAQAGYRPASTFKIFNALVGLETGAVQDEFEVWPWDHKKHSNPLWNRDTDLAGGMRNSTVWFYQAMARRIGESRMQAWIDKVGYGNGDIGGGIDQFWLSGKLRISALQQIDFLRRLAAGTLPFTPRAQEIVRRITVTESAPDFVLRGKTGWCANEGGLPDTGWYVGWVERAGRRWFVAVNVDLPSYGIEGSVEANGPKREAIARAVLRRVGALPAASN
jgi:beta-lactamase class D